MDMRASLIRLRPHACALLGLALTATASPLVAAPAAPPAGFVPGEAFTYKFSVGIVEAGRARMSIGFPVGRGKGRRLAVQGDAHSSSWLALVARLDDTYKVILDADSFVPTRVAMNETGIRTRALSSELDGTRLQLAIVAPGRDERYDRRLPGLVRDPVGGLFALRAHPLADGDRIQMLGLDGAALYRALITVTGREEIDWGPEDKRRRVRTIRLDCLATRIDDSGVPVAKMAPRHLRLYLSDDELRIPYRISAETDIGAAQLELTSYVPGAPGARMASADATATRAVELPPPGARSEPAAGPTPTSAPRVTPASTIDPRAFPPNGDPVAPASAAPASPEASAVRSSVRHRLLRPPSVPRAVTAP